jgi:hypothetical protein
MNDAEIKSDLDEVVGIAKIAFSSFFVLEYLHQTIFGMEGEIIDNNTFLRTSIFAYWRLTVLELTKLFPATKTDKNNHFALRLLVDRLSVRSDLFTAEETKMLIEEIDITYSEETNNGNKIVENILVQRDSTIAHTDRGRIIVPYGVSMANLQFLCRRAEVIIDIIHRKVYKSELVIGNVFEPRDHLRTLVDEIVGHRRRANFQARFGQQQ